MSELDLRYGVTLRRFSFEVMAAEVREEGNVLTLAIQAQVADRDNGTPIDVSIRRCADKENVETHPNYWHHVVRDALRCMVVHEIDELLMLGGHRIDPHAKVQP